MTPDRVDISTCLSWNDGLPRPDWDLLAAWIEQRVDFDQFHEAWTDVARQWIDALSQELGKNFDVLESNNFLLLAPNNAYPPDKLLDFAERCRGVLLTAASGITDFTTPGKQVVLSLGGSDNYYKYMSHYEQDDTGTSAGVHVRDQYPHIALCGFDLNLLENTLAHEMVHASLHYLTLPQWIEEGLAQMFEHDMTARQELQIDEQRAREHKEYWSEHGLQEFWHGSGFSQMGEGQTFNYELAEILIRLLWQDHRPRWFGFDKRSQQRFFQFMRIAKVSDAGARAARQCLQFSLGDLAAKFLGPGDWEPTTE